MIHNGYVHKHRENLDSVFMLWVCLWWGSINGNTPLRLYAELDSLVCRMVCKAWSMPSCPHLSPCKSPWHMQCKFCRITFSPSIPIIASWLYCFLPQLERDRCWCSLRSREDGGGGPEGSTHCANFTTFLIPPLVVLMPLLKWERQKKKPQGGSKPLGSHSFLTHMCVFFFSNFPKQHSAGMEQLASLWQYPCPWLLAFRDTHSASQGTFLLS